MAVKWGARRQILYYIVGAIILAVLLAAAYQLFLKKTPTCFDQVQNNNETGVDCGGSCALICPNVAKAPTVLWARSFETSPNIYTAAAYIQNNNVAISAGARAVRYTFRLYDAKNLLVAAKEGVIDIPPVQNVPIVEIGINTGTRDVARTLFEFTDDVASWNTVPASAIEPIRIVDTKPYQNGRLTATISNDSYDDVKKVQAVAVLFDSQGVARAASKAVVAKINHRATADVTFTWPEEFPDIIRAEVTVLPSF